MTRPVDLYSPCADSASPLLAPLRAQPGRRRTTPLSLCGAWPSAPHHHSRRTRAVHSWAAPVHYGALLEHPDADNERGETDTSQREKAFNKKISTRGEKALSQCEIRRESIFERAARKLGERTLSVDDREGGDGALALQISEREGEFGEVEGESGAVVGEGDNKALLGIGRTRKTGNIEKSQAGSSSLFNMPGIKSIVSRRRDIPSSPLVRRDSSSLARLSSEPLDSSITSSPAGAKPGGVKSSASGSGSTSSLSAAGLRKCETVLALTGLGGLGAVLRSTGSSTTVTHQGQALQAVNRLRVTPASSTNRLCSRCSSLLSLAAASGSRYSLNHATGFVPVCDDEPPMLCKLCLLDVPSKDTVEIQQCLCSFCKECMKAYVEFEVAEGAYDISCPDAQCPSQGVLNISEVERLVGSKLVEKHRKYRLNREVDLDASRTWCPRAGCETVCKLCPSERCSPQSVHCPTCTADFCSNCKLSWHSGLSCDENAKQLAKEGKAEEPGIPFDSDLIKCCPMCNVPIEKDEGCAQMMCKRCKHVFCWYCLTSLDDDFLLRHYDKGPCKNKLGHSRASVIWHRTQVIGIFAGFGILLLVASPLLLLAAPCIVCCKCRVCNAGPKLENEDDLTEEPDQTS